MPDDDFWTRYERWQDDCLAEFNEKYGEHRLYHSMPEEYKPWQLVEFSDMGDAYPHGIGGTGHIKNAVTPWYESPHYREW